MSSTQLSTQVLSLPLPDRVALAEALWQSINEGLASGNADEERTAIEEAQRRDAELISGAVAGRTHEQVMETARRVLGCG